MSEPSDLGDAVPAWLFDGHSALRHVVRVGSMDRSLLLSGFDPVPISNLYRLDDPRIIFGHRNIVGWRLGFDDPPPQWLSTVLPQASRYGGWIDRIGIIRAVIVFLALSIIAVMGGIVGMDFLARAIPFSWERKLGNALTGDFGGAICNDKAGQAALDRIAQRLSPPDRPMQINVIDIDAVNAVALPGGRILIFRGLIEQARSPDELAGVSAHEIGHVDRRHVMGAMIRRFGLSLVLGSNGRSGQYAQALLDSRYSRSAEREADAYAIEHLTKLQINPAATANFFDRLAASEGSQGKTNMLGYFASHPPSDERRNAFGVAARHMVYFRPVLDDAAWWDLKAICATTVQPATIRNGFRF